MKRSTFLVAVGAQAASFFSGAAGSGSPAAGATRPHGSIAPLSLPELVRRSSLIVTGTIICTEERAIRDGVFVGTAFLQIDSQTDAILLGAPTFTTVTTREKKTEEIAFGYLFGPMVPSSSAPFYRLGDDGIWFLDSVPAAAPRYGDGYNSLTPEQTYRKRNATEQVKAEIKRFVSSKNGKNKEAGATKDAS